jgi:putative alpha-1,2-mannosidase
LDRPFASYGTWRSDVVQPGSANVRGAESGGWVTFDATQNRTVRVQTAVSWVSLDGARANLSADATSWDIAAVRAATQARWRKLLS